MIVRLLKSKLGAAAIGAAAMWLFDPQRGRRRQAVVRDKARKLTRRASHNLEVATRDLNNRLTALPAELRARAEGRKPAFETNFDFLQRNWSPSTRLVVGSIGALMGLKGMRRGILGLPGLAMGAALVARAAQPSHGGALQAAKTKQQLEGAATRFQQSVEIDVPAERAFEFWSNLENLGQFLSHVRVVRMTDERHSRWTVEGPGGTDVRWTAETTAMEPHRRIAWRSLPDSMVMTSGDVMFTPLDTNRCRIDLDISYNPPAGQLGRAVANLFGVGAEQQVAEDLQKLKQILENSATVPQEVVSEITENRPA